MKLLDQYLYAIGRKLPYDTKKEIQLELKSLLLDELEARYGQDYTEADLKTFIKEYGSPSKVAARYGSDRRVIADGLTDLYFLILKLVAGALAIGFTVVFVVGIFQNGAEGPAFAAGLAGLIGNFFSAYLSAIGSITLTFMVMTKIYANKVVDLEEDWTPDDLKDIKLGPETESRIGSFFAIIFLTLFLAILNLAPGLIGLAEASFKPTGLLGHTVNIDLFKVYLIPISILWFAQIVYLIFNLFTGRKTAPLAIYEIFMNLLELILYGIMAFDMNLYQNYASLVGFRAIFLLVFVIGIFDLIGNIYNYFKYYIFSR